MRAQTWEPRVHGTKMRPPPTSTGGLGRSPGAVSTPPCLSLSVPSEHIWKNSHGTCALKSLGLRFLLAELQPLVVHAERGTDVKIAVPFPNTPGNSSSPSGPVHHEGSGKPWGGLALKAHLMRRPQQGNLAKFSAQSSFSPSPIIQPRDQRGLKITYCYA